MDLSELINKLPVAEQEKLFEQVAQYKDAVVNRSASRISENLYTPAIAIQKHKGG